MLHSGSDFLGGFYVSLSSNLWPYHRLAAGGGDQTLSLIATVEGLCLARHSGMILGLVDIFLLQKWVALVMGSQAETSEMLPVFQLLHNGQVHFVLLDFSIHVK